jgi:hypothetical protein
MCQSLLITARARVLWAGMLSHIPTIMYMRATWHQHTRKYLRGGGRVQMGRAVDEGQHQLMSMCHTLRGRGIGRDGVTGSNVAPPCMSVKVQ